MAASATRKKAPRLTDDELGQMLGLVNERRQVELKLTVPEADHRSAVMRSGWMRWTHSSGRCSSSIRQIWR